MGHTAAVRERQLVFNCKQRRILYVKSREERNSRQVKKKHVSWECVLRECECLF